jgi:hypothetical protein
MTLLEMATVMIFFSGLKWMAQREMDLCLARSRCSSR